MSAAAKSSWSLRPANDGDAAAVKELIIAAAIAAWGDFLGAERVERGFATRIRPSDFVRAL